MQLQSWEQAEFAAQAERENRDPVKQRPLEIDEEQPAKAAVKTASATVKNTTIAALERWMTTRERSRMNESQQFRIAPPGGSIREHE